VENSEENSAESFLLKIDMENWNFTLKKSWKSFSLKIPRKIQLKLIFRRKNVQKIDISAFLYVWCQHNVNYT
jgi:hypothetical protein